VATKGDGVDAVTQAILAHRAYLKESGRLERFRRDQARLEMEKLLRDRLFAEWQRDHGDGSFEAALERVLARQVAPRQAIEDLLSRRKL
jgi:LAO/AO transport system kinase